VSVDATGTDPSTATLLVDDVEFVKELYPRLREDDAAIERYRTSIDLLPPIIVARGRILVDGFHRWQAHRREGVAAVPVVDLGNLSDAEIFNESIRRNASHGQQLSRKDKQVLAGKLWQTFAHLPAPERTTEIESLLAVSRDSVERWTKDARTFERRAAEARAYDLWLDCHTDVEIGRAVGTSNDTARRYRETFAESASAEHANAPKSRQDFDVWNFGTTTDDAGTGSYFGKMPPQVVENLLWLYTDPGQIVFDPFAGGGTTIDVAKRMGRRVWSSDRKPSTPTLPIHRHDITTGWPEAAPRKVDLVLLDPPYWKQAAGRYSSDEDDLGNMALDEFMASWERVVKACADHLSDGGMLAYIISPSVDGDRVVDHAFDMYATCLDAGLTPHRRIIVTYNTQQATGQQVTWARDNKQLLKLYRDFVVFSA
jgi:hypothetical protein